ncbi:hypothetical protein EJ06DRAFT_97814 [Trichodelitschia bisporula]|uniref:DUF7137 domain-containing protein n=1 Tax=Trichodelitschia bisporula TaxID=703511 RepID=A0A6G1HQF5_9PEZI|nr:hypothetical protein EJ06DRAFT_97814 [Trichodelitschia bisporula]
MHLHQLVLVVASFFLLSAAWPWPQDVSGGLEKTHERAVLERRGWGLFRRQDDGDQAAASSGTKATSAAKTSSASNKASTGSKTTGSEKVTQTGSGSKGNTTDSEAAATTEFDPRLPAGGISMITPAPLSGAQYYKIGDFVTFAWNYTSLSVTPSAINIVASCKGNQATYTLAMNQSVSETGKIIWDTGKYQATATQPLLTNTYTLMIYDAGSAVTSIPRAGYLAVFNQFTFGMYTPQPYTPLSEFNCPTCSGAMSSMERQLLGFLFSMAAITVVSFTWFAGGFGVF